MRDFRTYVNDPAGNDPASNNFLGATNIVNFLSELKAAVTRSGLSLSTDDGTADSDTTQLAGSMFLHSVKSASFQAGGTVDAITLTPVSGSSGVLVPADYDDIEGAMINFVPSGANTGAVTVSIGQTSGTQLATKKLLDKDGVALVGGELGTDRIQAYYDPAADSSAGAWILTPWSTISGSAPTQVVIQSLYDEVKTVVTGSTNIPFDDSFPQISEGNSSGISVTITPTDSSNLLEISGVISLGSSASNDDVTVAVFQDSNADAIYATSSFIGASPANRLRTISFKFQITAGTTSATTFNIRFGGSQSGTLTLNGVSGGRLFGGALSSNMTVQEILAP